MTTAATSWEIGVPPTNTATLHVRRGGRIMTTISVDHARMPSSTKRKTIA
jgi:hypothetical protein